jgi:hypothetical protein
MSKSCALKDCNEEGNPFCSMAINGTIKSMLFCSHGHYEKFRETEICQICYKTCYGQLYDNKAYCSEHINVPKHQKDCVTIKNHIEEIQNIIKDYNKNDINETASGLSGENADTLELLLNAYKKVKCGWYD